MMGFLRNLIAWFLSILMAFGIGAGVNTEAVVATATDLQQKVTEHVDAITDELAGIADDVADAVRDETDKLRQSEEGQKVEEFLNDVREVVEDTVENIQEHFGPEETEAPETDAVDSAEGADA